MLVLVAKRAVIPDQITEGKQMLARVVGMLTKLVNMFSEDQQLREDAVDYRPTNESAQ